MSWRWVSTSEDQAYWQWVADRADVAWDPRSKGLIALRDNGDIDAGVLCDNWTRTSCTTHIAVENPMVVRAGFFQEVGRWLFEVCGMKVLVGITPSNNLEAIRFNRKLGWQEVARVPEGYDHGVDMVIQTMTPEQCRYYERCSNGR